jgi:hypothetical protein
MAARVSPSKIRAFVLAGGATALAGLLPPISVGLAAPVTTVNHCSYAQLKVKEVSAGAGLGHGGYRLHFRNTSHRVCSLRGYPGAAGLNKHGKQIEQAKRTKTGYIGGVSPGHPIPTVILEPGQQATSVVEGTDVPTAHQKRCRVLHGLLVTPPGDHKSVHVRHAPPDCSRIEIHPVVRNKTGRQGS